MDFSSLLSSPTELLLLLTLPWVIFSILSVLCDVFVGFIDEHLLHKLDSDDRDSIDAPKQLLLISGLFGLLVSVIAFIITITTPLSFALTREGFLFAFGAGILEILWLIPYFYALHRAGALNATPLLQSIPIFSLIFGLLLFSEIPTGAEILAAAFILMGGFLLNYSPDLKRLDIHTILLMLLSSATISLGFFLFKDASGASNFITAVFGNGLGMGVLSLGIWVMWKPYRQQFISRLRSMDTKIIFIQAGNEGLYSLSSLFNQTALVLGPTVMIVSSLGALHPLFTLLVGAILLQLGFIEKRRTDTGVTWAIKILAVLAITVGAFLIS